VAYADGGSEGTVDAVVEKIGLGVLIPAVKTQKP
jgi:hypothetical protein